MRKVVLWDFDGTLGYRRAGKWGAAFLEAVREDDPATPLALSDISPHLRHGFPWHTPETAHLQLNAPGAWWGSLQETVLVPALLTLGYPPPKARSLADRVRSRYVDTSAWALYGDTISALDALNRQGWGHILVSNHVPELGEIVSHLGLSGTFLQILNSAEVGYEKPHPEIFRLAREAAGHPDLIWMVGDNIDHDVWGAERVGIPAILVRTPVDAKVPRWCRDLDSVREMIVASDQA